MLRFTCILPIYGMYPDKGSIQGWKFCRQYIVAEEFFENNHVYGISVATLILHLGCFSLDFVFLENCLQHKMKSGNKNFPCSNYYIEYFNWSWCEMQVKWLLTICLMKMYTFNTCLKSTNNKIHLSMP